MSIQIDGDPIAAEEVLAQVKIWDKVIIGHEVSALVKQCANDVSMFDVSTQQNGLEEYKNAWEQFSPYFIEGTQITRRDIKIYASEELAVMHCHSKVEHEALKGKLQMPWCRTTLCMQKRDNQWCVVHQHISIPVDLTTGKAIVLQDIVLKDKPKLRLLT